MKGEFSMDSTKKLGLALISVDLAVIIAIIVMYPALSIIGIVAALYIGYKS